ncbi:gluconeogenesis factor YvcK family protein [Pediococcus pentosaceus]|uniref:gluconeogenesis factor YvcK family protein n=1 Tax=Pediococcus pentosaceus TaxID=1255 RepID=UPI00223BCBB0|nr:YvcK family protein [Pediococcus pentosaceus]MCS8571945.1 YvcK family protein [Pediococcus pentosaceus]
MTRKKGPKIVVIGGGTGLPVILKELHQRNAEITAIVTVADDGGSSGIIRDYVNVVPPGDIRNVMVALSDIAPEFKDIFQYRFRSQDKFLAGHAIGNLIIAALSEMRGGIDPAIRELSEMLQVEGHVYPASAQPLVLHAKFTDGTLLAGEAEITAAHKDIKEVWVGNNPWSETKKPHAVPEALQAIEEADEIILGPGSLFTSILPNLMIEDIGRAVLKAKAEIVYICNIMTQKGETINFTDAEHVRTLNRHLGQNFVDTVLVNTEIVPESYMDFNRYDEVSKQVVHDFKGLREQGARVISDNFLLLRDGGAFHDGQKVVDELMNGCSNPIKKRD